MFENRMLQIGEETKLDDEELAHPVLCTYGSWTEKKMQLQHIKGPIFYNFF